MQVAKIIEVSLIAYLIGSIPTGYIIGKLRGKDLRREGSGNIGATNAVRVLGKKWGYPVFFVDFFKGIVAVALAWAASKGEPQLQRELLALGAAILAILGHTFPIWLNFKGGKGVATTAGVTLTLFPWQVFVIALISWMLVFFTTRYVSLASLTAAIVIPTACFILFWLGKIGLLLLWTGLAICALVLWRHRGNFSRLIAGTEPKFTKKTKEIAPPSPPSI